MSEYVIKGFNYGNEGYVKSLLEDDLTICNGEEDAFVFQSYQDAEQVAHFLECQNLKARIMGMGGGCSFYAKMK